jgi:hypothetical protein
LPTSLSTPAPLLTPVSRVAHRVVYDKTLRVFKTLRARL